MKWEKSLGLAAIHFSQKIKSGRFTPSECMAYCKYFKKSFDYLFATDDEKEAG